MEAVSSFQLLRRCRAGDPAALDEFARRFAPEIERLAYTILDETGRPAIEVQADAQDAAQEALLAALDNLDRFRGDSDLRTWLIAIAVNVCRRKLRTRRAQQRLLAALGLALAGLQPGRAGGVERQVERRVDLRAALLRLDEKHRMPLLLHYGHGLSVAETARALGVNANTVLSRLYHGREKLRRLMEGEDSDDRE